MWQTNKKPDRGYVLWQIQDIIGVYTIVNIINGWLSVMRTPKVEALNRTINWLNNNYICDNKYSEVLSTKKNFISNSQN